MPSARFVSPFPRLDLNQDERAQLHASAHALVDDVQGLYEKFLWEDHSAIDAGQWTLTRTREDVRVYHDRRVGAGTGNKDMHLLLTVGSVCGELSDAMYGVLNATTDAMRIKTAYVHDTLLDSAVLETIVAPTIDEPFESMTVRWFVKGVPRHVRAISKHRDNVYLEATGWRQLAHTGERVGYHLMHSISFDKTPRLPMYDRFNMSICTLWREAAPQRVEAFMTSYIEIKESPLLVPMVVKSTADALVSLWKVVECAQHKKLAYLVGSKPADNANGRASGDHESCALCATHSRSVRRGIKSTCVMCSKATCDKCRVKRELAFLAPDGALLLRTKRVCLACLTTAHLLDATTVARREAAANNSSIFNASASSSNCHVSHRAASNSRIDSSVGSSTTSSLKDT